MSDNIKSFLDMIAVSELGEALLHVSDNGYNVIVGSTADRPILFDSYADHPRRLITLPNGLRSTAAGRYQLLARYFDAYKQSLGLPDFGPDSQDAIATQQITERGALDDVVAGRLYSAITKCSNIWASFPGSPYGQHTNSSAFMESAYTASGGTLA